MGPITNRSTMEYTTKCRTMEFTTKCSTMGNTSKCGHNEVQRDVGLRFGRTQETMKRKFFEVLTATELLACDFIITPRRQELLRISDRFLMDSKYWPFFSGFVGAMDGVHVCVKVKPALQVMYWSRHSRTSFNIMAICDFNMLFTYVWNGAP
ncbi:hypothetical protein V5N11_030355 [Cardamine amara subsp. amara]|uniref:DDE Tnp4 domain-containing protein n=1 Tax=Cardamine amara subsp. amara TaxID=228776 RepID=A0ABD1AVE2_CARAN